MNQYQHDIKRLGLAPTRYEILEEEYAKFVGTKYAVSCSSGTAALHLALVALKIGLGDEVIVPDFTMAACGFAVSYTGAKVVTVDCGEDLNINVTKIEEKINENTKAIMPVHIYGRLCDMQAIRKIAEKHSLKIIEDACEAQMPLMGGNSDCLVFSFFKNKIIHAEEGGIVCTDSKEIYENIKDLKNMCFGKSHNYFHERIGYNYRMPESQATFVLESLNKYSENNRRRRLFERHWQSLIQTKSRDAVWVYDIKCQSAEEKNKYIEEMIEKKVTWRHFFKPLSSMPMWKQTIGRNAADFSNRGFYLNYYE